MTNEVECDLFQKIAVSVPLFTLAFLANPAHAVDWTEIEEYRLRLSGVTVSPVPEPETYAMLLAGLGLMGRWSGGEKDLLHDRLLSHPGFLEDCLDEKEGQPK